MEHHHCIIIGSGPSGYTAALYAARAGMKPVLYTGPEMGGQLMITTDVENYPGYPDGVGGPQMMDDFRKQAERDSVIISTGASAKWLGLESEQRLMNQGVSACAVCDGFFFRGQEVIIVGAGDTAAEEATYLSKLCPKVHMLIRRDEMRASKIMQKRVIDSPNIEIYWNTETVEVLGKEEVEGARVKNNKTGEESTIDAKGFFVAIGHKPNTGIFKPYIEMDEVGYINAIPGTSKTNIPGVFVGGDAADKVYRQAVTAAGTGCMAALDAERYLTEKEII